MRGVSQERREDGLRMDLKLDAQCSLHEPVGPVALRAAEPPANAVTLHLVLERSFWSLHEPVLVTLEAVNSSSFPISLDLGRDFMGNLRVVFSGPGGQVTVGRLPELPDGLYLPGTIKLAPGQTYREPLVLNDWHAFAETGAVKVDISLPVDRQPGLPDVLTASAAASLEIGPRDAAQLAATCKQLEAKALHGKAESAAQAGHALSFADDETCLPALEQVLRQSPFARYEALRGLARLGAVSAVAAVVNAWEILDPFQAATALADFDAQGIGASLRAALAKAGKSLPSSPLLGAARRDSARVER
jgi:hypothetical protein